MIWMYSFSICLWHENKIKDDSNNGKMKSIMGLGSLKPCGKTIHLGCDYIIYIFIILSLLFLFGLWLYVYQYMFAACVPMVCVHVCLYLWVYVCVYILCHIVYFWISGVLQQKAFQGVTSAMAIWEPWSPLSCAENRWSSSGREVWRRSSAGSENINKWINWEDEKCGNG